MELQNPKPFTIIQIHFILVICTLQILVRVPCMTQESTFVVKSAQNAATATVASAAHHR